MRYLLVALLCALSYAQTVEPCTMKERRASKRLDGEILVVEGQSFTMVTDITSCEALCVHHHAPDCNGFTFIVPTKRCFLKTSVSTFTSSTSEDDISSFCKRPSVDSSTQPKHQPVRQQPSQGSGGPPEGYVDAAAMSFPFMPLMPAMPAQPAMPSMFGGYDTPMMPGMSGLPNMGTMRMMNCEPLTGPMMCTRSRGCIWKGFECDNVNCETQVSAQHCATTPGCSWVVAEMKCNDYEEGFNYQQGGGYLPNIEALLPGFMSMMPLQKSSGTSTSQIQPSTHYLDSSPSTGHHSMIGPQITLPYVADPSSSNGFALPDNNFGMAVSVMDPTQGLYGSGMKLKKTRKVQDHSKEFYNEDGSTFYHEKWMKLKLSTCSNMDVHVCQVEKACEWRQDENECHPLRFLSASFLETKNSQQENHFRYFLLAFIGGSLGSISAIATYRWRMQTSKESLLA